ncbi:Avr-Pita1 protein (Effector protein) [Salix suchowensis]|nr:Avr-Pita1 protein (Effector protein) [Salix suchowensis]
MQLGAGCKIGHDVSHHPSFLRLTLAHSQMLRSLQRQLGTRTHIQGNYLLESRWKQPETFAEHQHGFIDPGIVQDCDVTQHWYACVGQSGQQYVCSGSYNTIDAYVYLETQRAQVLTQIHLRVEKRLGPCFQRHQRDASPPPLGVRNLRSTATKSEHSRHARRQTMTAREINAFDDMFNMIFNAVSEQKLSSKGPNAEGPGIGRDAASLRRHSKRMKWTSEFDELLDRKKEAINLCDNDQQLLEWGMTEVFGESQKYEAAWRESPDLPMQPPTVPGQIRRPEPRARDIQLREESVNRSYVFGCSTQAYNELIETRWTSFQDLKGVHDALEEMIVNGVELDSRTRKLVDTVRHDIGGQRAGWRDVNDVFGKEMWNLMTKIDGLVKAGTPESPDGRLRLDEWKTIGDDDERGWDFDSWSGSVDTTNRARDPRASRPAFHE